MNRRVNVDHLVKEALRFQNDDAPRIIQESSIRVTVPDPLTLIRSIDPTLLKDVWTARSCGEFTVFATFGVPENKNWLVTLHATEQ